jgi:ABC-2 type transport system ATP-binding protein
VVTKPFPEGAPASLQEALGGRLDVRPVSAVSLLVSGPADSTTLATVSALCARHDVLPESLHLGQRTLEDVFLEITGRELS